MDCIDIHVEVPAVRYKDLSSQDEGEASADIRERMNRARVIQSERLKRTKIHCNAQESKWCQVLTFDTGTATGTLGDGDGDVGAECA